LNGCAADEAWNSTQALDTPEATLHTIRDNLVPVFAGSGAKLGIVPRPALDADPQNQPFEASVCNEKIRSASQNKDRKTLALCEIETLENLPFGHCIKEVPGGATHAKCRPHREWQVFLKGLHAVSV